MIQCSGGELLCPVSLQPAVCDNVWFGGGQEPAEPRVPASILSRCPVVIVKIIREENIGHGFRGHQLQ